MPTERLSPLSAAFLQIEDEDPSAALAIGSITVFEPPAPTFEEFASAIAGRLPLLPRYRQRLQTVPFDLAAPSWADDPHFDVRWHLRSTALPAPGGKEEMCWLMSRVMTHRMDRSRPLWEYWFVEGLEGGRWALLSKIHHSMVDGVSGTDIYRLILDLGPEPMAALPDHWQPEPESSPAAVLGRAAWDLVTTPAATARALGAAARSPSRLARRTLHSAHGLLTLAGALRMASPSSLVGPLDGSRRFCWTTIPMADILQVRQTLGCSVNDVALAAISGGFRHLLLERGEPADPHALRSLVPVNVRAPGQERLRDNRVSLMLPYLPVEIADPRKRLEAVRERIRSLHEAGEPDAGESVTGLAQLGPFPPVSFGVRLAFHLRQRLITTVTTNVPGPREPLYGLGRRVEAIIPYVPIADRVRIGIAMFSYCGTFTFGITGDYRFAPDLHVLAEGIEQSLAELTEVARAEVTRAEVARAGAPAAPAVAAPPRVPRPRSPRPSRG